MISLEDSRKFLEPALAYGGGTHIWQDVIDGVATGRMQLWPAEDAAAITEIINFPRKTMLHCFLAGGNKETIIDMIDSAVAWGKTQGCEGFTLSGRMGWQRELAKYGFKAKLVTMERKIE